jgi:hypothetical protein
MTKTNTAVAGLNSDKVEAPESIVHAAPDPLNPLKPETLRASNGMQRKPQPGDPNYDPFAEENLLLPQDFLDEAVSAPALTSIRLGKPDDQEWVRVHPTCRIDAGILSVTAERGAKYLIHPTFIRELPDIKFSLSTLYLYTTSQGNLGFWDIKMQGERENVWLSTATEAAHAAMPAWKRVFIPRGGDRYQHAPPFTPIADPDWEKITLGKGRSELLRIAFRDRLIMSADHPVIKSIRRTV